MHPPRRSPYVHSRFRRRLPVLRGYRRQCPLHGEERDVYDYLNNKNCKIIDLTCPKLKKIHDLILEHQDSYVIVIGKKNLPEVLGHISYA